MLSRIFRWIGLTSAPPKKAPPRTPARPRSATAHLFEKRSMQGPAARKPGTNEEPDFNPYNTGKFDRSASWERISKNQR